jgi:hypothetical protein
MRNGLSAPDFVPDHFSLPSYIINKGKSIFASVMLVNVNRHQKCQELFFLLPQVCKEKNSRKDSCTQCQGGSHKFLQ